MKALILIGGLGTRLRPLTCHTPKPLLPIVNKPFLEYQFELIKSHGINEVTLCLAYMPHVFEKHLGSGKKWGLKINYVHEKEPLGTGGAIRNAIKHIDETTVVFNGDILTDINLKSMLAFHRKNKSFVTIALTRVKDPTAFGLVETDKTGRIERFLEKPSWDEVTCNTINAGIYVFKPQAVELIPAGVSFSVERGLFPNLLARQYRIFGYTFNGYWMDIGTVEKYMQANFDLMSGNYRFTSGSAKAVSKLRGAARLAGNNSRISGNLVCGKNVKIGDFVQLNGNVCLGDGVVISKGSSLSDTIVLKGTAIGEGVKAENAIIGEDCVIEPNSVLGQMTVLGNKTLIRKYSKL